jgi:glycogen synthase
VAGSERPYTTWEWQRYKTEVQNGLLASDLVVTPSAAMLRALNTHYGPLKEGRVIYNGRNPENFKPQLKRSFILSAGRLWDEAKNIQRVAEIATQLPWPVLVAGEYQHPEQPDRHSLIASQCRWLGSLPESQLRSWYASASIYALPALYEPFGYTPLEAALSGCALVLGDIESLREVWGDAAVFVDPTDSKALKNELLALIDDPQRRAEMSRRAHERALEFTSTRMAENYVVAYGELVATNDFVENEELVRCA